MSIFFLYVHKGNPLGNTILSTIAEKIIYFPWVNSSTYTEKNLQLVYTTNKSDLLRIFKDPLHNLTFFLQGNIFESTKGISKIDENNKEYVLENQLKQLYLEKGISACVGLNGIYNLIVWDYKTQSLEVAVDRLGISQIFFTPIGNDGFILTSDIATLKLIPQYSPGIDRRGIFDILYMGTAFAEQTVLRGVYRLLPNACYHVTHRGLQLLKEFRLPFSKDRWNKVTSKIIEELEHFYLSAIKRQLNTKQKLICLQSGGKDSRLLSYHLKKANIISQFITIGEKHHSEVFLANQVDRVLGFPWKRVNITPDFNNIFTKEFFHLTNFSSRIFIPFQINLFPGISQEWDYLLSTLCCDPLFGSALGQGKWEEQKDNLNVFENYLKFWRSSFFTNEELEKLIGSDARDFIVDYREKAYRLFCESADEPYQRLMAYDLRTDVRFKVGGLLNCFNAVCPVRLPCIDNDLMDFLFSLPVALLYKRNLIDLYLIKNTKALASIPFDQNGKKCRALAPNFKNTFNYTVWLIYNQKIKVPILRFVDPQRATTQAYLQFFSLWDKGFKKIINKSLGFLPCAEGVLNIDTAKNFLKRPIPKNPNHIMSGNSIRSLINAIWAINLFVGTDGQ